MIFSDFTYNSITFNRFVRSTGYMASAIRGDRIQIRTTKDPLPSQDGIQRYIDYYGSRLLEINGFVKGISEADLYEKINALQKAFDINTLQDNESYDYGFLPLEWTDPGQTASRYYVKPIANTLIISEQRDGLARRFSVLMEAKDPKKYGTVQTSYTINISDTGGASQFPFAFPVAFGSSVGTGSTTINNDSDSSEIIDEIKLVGPTSGTWTGAKVTNTTTGKYIGFISSFAISTGEYISILPTGEVRWYQSNGTYIDGSVYLLAGSSFFKLESGDNTILIEGASIPSTAYAIITLTNPL